MKVVCKKCGKISFLNQDDLQKIKEIFDKNTFHVKVDNFLCFNCIVNNYSGKVEELIESRRELGLDIDKYDNR